MLALPRYNASKQWPRDPQYQDPSVTSTLNSEPNRKIWTQYCLVHLRTFTFTGCLNNTVVHQDWQISGVADDPYDYSNGNEDGNDN